MRTVITRRSLGVVWDERRVQACLVRSGLAEFVIEDIVVVPRELDEAGNPLRPPAEDLRAVVDRMGSGSETCVAALPEAEIMYRKLTRPFSDRRKIMETIGPEVETMLPALDSKLLVDFVLLGKNTEGSYTVQALCAKTSSVMNLVDVWKSAGLDPEIVDCPSVSMASGARTLFDLPQDKLVVVLHVGWSETSVAVLAGGVIKNAWALPYGLDAIVSAGATRGADPMPVDLEGLRTRGVEGGDVLAGMFREILIMLDRSVGLEGEQVLLATGYSGLIRDLEGEAREKLGMSLVTPRLKDVQVRAGTDLLLDAFLSVSLACRGGSSDDPVNFRQGELGLNRRFRKVMGEAGPWVKAAVVLLVIWVMGLGLNVFLKSRTNADLTKKIRTEFSAVMPKGTPMVDPVKQMEQYLTRLSGQAGVLEGASTGTPLEIIKDLSAGIPGSIDVMIDSINIDGESITLTGSTGKYDDVEQIQAVLARLPYIKEVKILSANVDKNDQKVKMRLTCRRQI